MPEIRSTGGIFLRLDSSGNLNIYDTTGTSIAKFLSGALSISGNRSVYVTNGSITNTTSLTTVYRGTSAQITPQISTVLVLLATFPANSNNTAGDGGEIQVVQNTGTNNPAGGGAAAGTIVAFGDMVGTTNETITLAQFVTGLTVGQAYTFSVAIKALTGGTFTVSGSGIRDLQLIEL